MPPAPITDRAALEAALSNASADACLVLEAAKDADRETPHHFTETARADDPMLAYLVLGTSWPVSSAAEFASPPRSTGNGLMASTNASSAP